ncbi:hypothetical protein ACFL2H_05195 [Planctomycetota bacterium]
MPLTLDHRWEHALIAETISRAKKSCPACYTGRTAIQKFLYFMKVRGVPMNYDFEIYNYGPYCSSVSADVEWLQADGVVTDDARQDRYSDYRTTGEANELLRKYSDQLSEQLNTVHSVVDALCGKEPDRLELDATLDFCFRWVRARGGDGPYKEDAIAKFIEIKKNKFEREDIEAAYDSLVNARLIES